MLNELKEWVEAALGARYAYSMGQWVEPKAGDTKRYCVIQAAGGAGPDVDVRRPRFRVLLLGRRNERADANGVMADADALVVAGMGDMLPCGAANIRATSEPMGPGYTTENRAWCSFEFEVIF